MPEPVTLKRLDYDFTDGQVIIETWKGSSGEIYTTVDVYGTVDLTTLENAITLFKKEITNAEHNNV